MISQGETKMNRFKNLLAVFAFSLLVLGLPSFASAQWGNRDRDDNYGRGGGYNHGYVNSAVKRLRNDSRNFERRLDRELDRSRINGRVREDQINRLARDFKNAADRLEKRFDNRGNLSRSQNEARQVLMIGEQLDRELRRLRTNSSIQNDWNRMRQDMSVIANAYGFNNRNYPRGNTNGDWRNRIPFPFPF
jgi:hypothetical protein